MHSIDRNDWKWLADKGDLSPWIKCPLCGHWIALIDYDVGDKGMVAPMVNCPHKKCTFVEDVQLEGWRA